MHERRDSTWIIRFLQDLRDHAEKQNLNSTAEAIAEAIETAEAEIDRTSDGSIGAVDIEQRATHSKIK